MQHCTQALAPNNLEEIFAKYKTLQTIAYCYLSSSYTIRDFASAFLSVPVLAQAKRVRIRRQSRYKGTLSKAEGPIFTYR